MNTSNATPVSKDRIMDKIQEEANFRHTGVDNRKRAGYLDKSSPKAIQELPRGEKRSEPITPSSELKLDLRLGPAVSPQPVARPSLKEYRLSDLTPFYDSEFINVAYHAILHRAPDPQGYAHYLEKLRQGMHKVEILGWLRYSPEGKKTNTKVIGLAGNFAKRRFYRLPIVGRIAEVLFGLWNLPNTEKNHRANFNHAIRFAVEAQAQIHDSLKNAQVAMIDIERKFADLEARLQASQIQAVAQTEELERVMQQAIRRREAAHGELVAFAATRLGREALTPLEANIQVLRTASDTNRSATADSFGVIRQTQAQIGAVDAVQKHLQASLTSFQSSLSKSLELVAESKADRKSLESVASSLELLSEKKIDRVSAESLIETVKHEVARSIRELRQAHATLAVEKADHASIRALGEQNDAAARSLFNEVYGVTQAAMQSKADLVALDSTRTELKHLIGAGLAAIQHRLQELTDSKADRSIVQSTHEEVKLSLRKSASDLGQMLQSLAETKVEKVWVASAIAQAQVAAAASAQKANNDINAVLRTKADRLALDVGYGELRASVRALQSTIDKLRERIEPPAQADLANQTPANSGVSNIGSTKPVDRIRGL
jgi:Domain of unknown function (DUF4214)